MDCEYIITVGVVIMLISSLELLPTVVTTIMSHAKICVKGGVAYIN